MTNARDKANIPVLNFQSKGIDDNADATAITINSSEQVGIGTTSPGYPLEINSSAQSTLLHLVSTAGTFSQITFANTGSNDSIAIGAENDDLKLRTDDGVIKFFTNENSEKMRITSAGNVGIGTTSPSQPLTVSSSTTNAPLKLITTGSQTYSGIVFESTQSDDYVGIGVDGENLKLRTDDGHITFHVAENSEKMRITSSGNVGIGTTSPQNKIDINATTWGDGIRIKNSGNFSAEIGVDTNRSVAGGGIFNLASKWNGTEVAGILFQAGSDTTNKDDGEILFRTASAGTVSEKVRITLDGKVGIGTSSPTQKLDVNGTVKATAFQGDGSALTGVGGANTPAFAVRKNSTQSISVNTHTKIAFNSEDFDTAGAFDTSNSRFTVPSGQGGKYFINLSSLLDTAGNYEPISFQIRKNGNNIINAYGENQYYSSFYISIIASLSAGDYLEAYVYQTSDGAKNITNDPINFFGGFKLIE